MAIGDTAAAAGLDLVSGAALANTLDTEENKTRDYVGDLKMKMPPRIRTGTSLPGTSGNTVGEIFVRYA
ncbi:hypothetical protein D3C87_2133440 [compost metagenome]